MELLIKIPDEVYKTVLDGSYCGSLYEELLAAIPYNPSGDLISREALKDALQYRSECGPDCTGMCCVDCFCDLINNAPAVEPFTQLEKEEIAAAIKYLLGAELLEENGYTEEVIRALKSALKKVGGEEE